MSVKGAMRGRAYECNKCTWVGEKAWAAIHYAKKHLTAEEAPIVCKLCGYKTASEENLSIHLKRKQHKKKLESMAGKENEDFIERRDNIEKVIDNFTVYSVQKSQEIWNQRAKTNENKTKGDEEKTSEKLMAEVNKKIAEGEETLKALLDAANINQEDVEKEQEKTECDTGKENQGQVEDEENVEMGKTPETVEINTTQDDQKRTGLEKTVENAPDKKDGTPIEEKKRTPKKMPKIVLRRIENVSTKRKIEEAQDPLREEASTKTSTSSSSSSSTSTLSSLGSSKPSPPPLKKPRKEIAPIINLDCSSSIFTNEIEREQDTTPLTRKDIESAIENTITKALQQLVEKPSMVATAVTGVTKQLVQTNLNINDVGQRITKFTTQVQQEQKSLQEKITISYHSLGNDIQETNRLLKAINGNMRDMKNLLERQPKNDIITNTMNTSLNGLASAIHTLSDSVLKPLGINCPSPKPGEPLQPDKIDAASPKPTIQEPPINFEKLGREFEQEWEKQQNVVIRNLEGRQTSYPHNDRPVDKQPIESYHTLKENRHPQSSSRRYQYNVSYRNLNPRHRYQPY